jgi:acyl-CoA synthetase (NDP forming)
MSSGAQDLHPVDLKRLFYPKSIAVIGVNKNRIGGIKYVFANQDFVKKGGKVFPINPKYEELFGFKVYPSLFDPQVPEIDLAYISVSAKFVPGVVRECGKKKVKFAVIFTSGFSESGNQELQKELELAVKEAKKKGTRFIGPNCLGINNPYSRIHYYPGMPEAQGNISYVSMSGGNTGRLAAWMVSQGSGFSNVVSIGNSIDLTPTDFLYYFRDDPKTKVIALYIESIHDGRKFIEAVKKVNPIKPIVLLKGGQSKVGVRAVQSHTGGLAGSFEIWRALAKQYGLILTDHFELFQDALTAFSINYHLPKNENVCILVAGGGISVEIADVCIANDLKVPPLSADTRQKLASIFPTINTNFTNPVDLGELGYIPEMFAQALEIVARDTNIETILFVREAERFHIFAETMGRDDMEQVTIDSISNVLKKVKKPMFCSTSPNGQEERAHKARLQFKKSMLKENLPVIDYIPNVAKIIKQMICYRRYLEKVKIINEKKRGN